MNASGIIEEKIIDFFNRFSEEKNENMSRVKLVMQLIDDSTVNLVPTYSVHSDTISEYCFIQAVVKLTMLEKMAVSYQDINNKIGAFFVKQAAFHRVPVSTLKGMIAIREGKIVAGMFHEKKYLGEFNVKDFIN